MKTFHGSCHCGAVRYEADLDLSSGTTRCNCRYCTKTASWGKLVKPDAFRLLSGEDSLFDYSRHAFGHNRSCKVCGVRVFGDGNIPELGGAFVSVNLHTLDDAQLEGTTVTYLDGRADTWAPLAARPHVNPFA